MVKKGLAMALGLVMLCAVTACGKKAGGETEGATVGTEAAETETEKETQSKAEETETETAGGETAEAPKMPEYVSAFDLGDISEYVELGEYKGIEVEAMDTEVTDEEIEEEIKALVEAASPFYEQVTEGTIAEGDVVNIDYEGRMDGEVFQGGTGSDFNLTIGSGQFIPGFEDGLIGKKIGETTVLKLNFPENYTVNPDFSGKPVEFTVTINYVQGEELPKELNEAFVERETNGTCKTVDEYRKYMRTQMEEGKVADAKTGKINGVWDKIEENATFKKEAEELIAYNYDSQIYQAESMVSMYGMDLATYLQATGMTEEQFQSDIRDYAEQSARWQILVRAVVEAEGLEPTDEEYKSGLEKLSEETGMDVETMQSNYSETMLRDILRQQAVQDFLEETAVEVPAKTE